MFARFLLSNEFNLRRYYMMEPKSLPKWNQSSKYVILPDNQVGDTCFSDVNSGNRSSTVVGLGLYAWSGGHRILMHEMRFSWGYWPQIGEELW